MSLTAKATDTVCLIPSGVSRDISSAPYDQSVADGQLSLLIDDSTPIRDAPEGVDPPHPPESTGAPSLPVENVFPLADVLPALASPSTSVVVKGVVYNLAENGMSKIITYNTREEVSVTFRSHALYATHVTEQLEIDIAKYQYEMRQEFEDRNFPTQVRVCTYCRSLLRQNEKEAARSIIRHVTGPRHIAITNKVLMLARKAKAFPCPYCNSE